MSKKNKKKIKNSNSEIALVEKKISILNSEDTSNVETDLNNENTANVETENELENESTFSLDSEKKPEENVDVEIANDFEDKIQDKTEDENNKHQINIQDSNILQEYEQVNDNNTQIILKKKKSHKKYILFFISFAIVSLLFLTFSTIFALTASHSSTIINGVSIKNIDVSGLTKEQALEKLTSYFNEKLSQKITLKHNDYNIDVFANQFDVSFELQKAVDSAYLVGRSGNIFQNNYSVLGSMISGTNITPSFSYNEESVKTLVTEMESNFSDRLINSSYYVDGNDLVLVKGKDGVVINLDNFKKELAYAINNLHANINEINIPVEQKQATALDINKIHEEVYRAPQDAYYTTDPYVVYPHVDGIDFSISVEEAKNGYDACEENYIVPLQVLSPNVTTNQIGTEAFPDLLGSFSTTFATSNGNRSTNIRLAASKINGTVVMPGEIFSYNQTVGQRTAAAGFKSAAVYSGGEVTTGIGGGICQVSSTLYNAVLLANLEIVARMNHGFNPGYVPAGRDATVSWGGPDFKFKNTRNYPIRVVCSVSGGTILAQIFGLKTEDDYEVEIESYITSYISYKTIQQNDASLAKGTTKVLQSGSNGCRSVCYRILKKDGEVVSKTLLSNDTYSPHNKVVAVGTRE